LQQQRNSKPSLEARIASVERVIFDLDRTVSVLIENIAKYSPSMCEEKHDIQMKDAIWYCTNCKSKCGVIDRSSDEIRIRYKDHIVYCVVGKGGHIKTPCRRCSYMNELKVDV
tara:strand:- start:29301 stop:29639 length:339 start_codon:yes stop_codon:yes gene_type:complete